MNQKVVVYNEDYITNLLATKAEENTYLEFKRADSLIIHPNNKSKNLEEIKNEIAKDVSAFANSDGGVLIYGIAEDNHVATDYSFIDGNTFTKETLEQIINSRIHRKIDGLRIEPIRFKNDITKTIYIVEIPRSTNAPHQIKDKLFYKRRNFMVEAMEEYEIRDLYNRKSNVQLEILNPIINVDNFNVRQNNIGYDFNLEIKIGFIIKNIGNVIEEFYKTEIRLPKHLEIANQNSNQTLYSFKVRYENNYTLFSIPSSSAIFQDEILSVNNVRLKIQQHFLKDIKNFPIIIKLYFSNGTLQKEFNLFDLVDNHLNGELSESDVINEILSK